MLKKAFFTATATLLPLLASAGQPAPINGDNGFKPLGVELGTDSYGLVALGLVSLIIGAQVINKRRK